MNAVTPIREDHSSSEGRGAAGSGEAPARLSPALLEGGPGARHDHLEPPVAPVAQRSAAALGGCLRRCVESAA